MQRVVRASLNAQAAEHAAANIDVEHIDRVAFALLYVEVAGISDDLDDAERTVLGAASATGAPRFVPGELVATESVRLWNTFGHGRQADDRLQSLLRLPGQLPERIHALVLRRAKQADFAVRVLNSEMGARRVEHGDAKSLEKTVPQHQSVASLESPSAAPDAAGRESAGLTASQIWHFETGSPSAMETAMTTLANALIIIVVWPT